MDRDRLKQVQQTDLTESRVNEDFVNWLKTKAPTYLLLILLAIAGFLFFQRWRSSGERRNAEAWSDLMKVEFSGGDPGSIAEWAEDFKDIPGVWILANEYAAEEYLTAFIRNRPLTAGPDDLTATLTGDDRTEYLQLMTTHFQNILEMDEQTAGTAIHGFNGHMGLATVAECRGDLEAAANEYRAAASRVEGLYDDLQSHATHRAESVGELQLVIELAEGAPAALPNRDDITPARIDLALGKLIHPPVEDETSTDTIATQPDDATADAAQEADATAADSSTEDGAADPVEEDESGDATTEDETEDDGEGDGDGDGDGADSDPSSNGT